MTQRIAIVSADADNLRTLTEVLEREGYAVEGYGAGEQTVTMLAAEPPDVLLLEMAATAVVPSLMGLLQETRGQGPATIAIVRQDQSDRYDYTLGVDDFVLWPTTPTELAMRVRQSLWRRANINSAHLLKLGDLIIDLANYKVYVAGRPVELTFKEYELLRFLATHRDRVYSREALLNHVWGYDYYGGARTVDVHIRRLRSKVEDRTHAFIETVRNVGYRFRVPN